MSFATFTKQYITKKSNAEETIYITMRLRMALNLTNGRQSKAYML
jgi:hypothetical protein